MCVVYYRKTLAVVNWPALPLFLGVMLVKLRGFFLKSSLYLCYLSCETPTPTHPTTPKLFGVGGALWGFSLPPLFYFERPLFILLEAVIALAINNRSLTQFPDSSAEVFINVKIA